MLSKSGALPAPKVVTPIEGTMSCVEGPHTEFVKYIYTYSNYNNNNNMNTCDMCMRKNTRANTKGSAVSLHKEKLCLRLKFSTVITYNYTMYENRVRLLKGYWSRR